MAYTPQTWADSDSSKPLSAARMTYMENGIAAAAAAADSASAGSPGEVALDSFTGATDDLKLSAAMSYCAALTYKPRIRMANRAHSFSTSLGHPYDGFSLIGSGTGWLNPEQGIKHTQATITLSSAAWINITGAECWNVNIEGINFIGGGTTTQFASAPSGHTAWAWSLEGLTFQNFAGVLGNYTTQFTTDLCSFGAKMPWQILTCRDVPIHIAGADNRALWTAGMNIGSGDQGPSSGAGGGKFLMMFTSCSKTNVGGIYLTADNGWRGVLCTGSLSSGYGLVFQGGVYEGRNPGDPCDGNLIRVEGGAVDFRQTNVNSGMAAPTASGISTQNANGLNDRGLIEVVGSAQAVFDGVTVSHATGVAVTTPALYKDSSSSVTTLNFLRSTRSGSPSWGSQLPVIGGTNTGFFIDDVSSA